VKPLIVIPTYWSRPGEERWRPGDAVYDHPTPLDGKGTLERALKSLDVLEDRDFDLAVVAVPTAAEIEEAVERKVSKLLSSAPAPALLVGPTKIEEVRESLRRAGKAELGRFLSLKGYPNVRNICLFIAGALGSEVAVLIDDDEVIEDPCFLSRALEFMGRRVSGGLVLAKAGYYVQGDGGYLLKTEQKPWMEHWDKVRRMNEAFELFIGRGGRLRITPFVFGGNMVVHRLLYSRVPFDPGITRGEDIDYLINARMFGFNFYLDRELAVKHLPPPKVHPLWMRLREDFCRFLYERAKLRAQRRMEGMAYVSPESLDPYPGAFLKDDLDEKINKASHALAESYLSSGDERGAREALRNLELIQRCGSPGFNPFDELLRIQRRWAELMELVSKRMAGEVGEALKDG